MLELFSWLALAGVLSLLSLLSGRVKGVCCDVGIPGTFSEASVGLTTFGFVICPDPTAGAGEVAVNGSDGSAALS